MFRRSTTSWGFHAWLSLVGMKLSEGMCDVRSFLRDPTLESLVRADVNGQLGKSSRY
ncbi:MAG: hypothetical protein QXP80_03905 [Zestosphaera sp.]